MMNENAISNILIDVDFLEGELKRMDRSHLASVFVELRMVRSRAFLGTIILTSLSQRLQIYPLVTQFTNISYLLCGTQLTVESNINVCRPFWRNLRSMELLKKIQPAVRPQRDAGKRPTLLADCTLVKDVS